MTDVTPVEGEYIAPDRGHGPRVTRGEIWDALVKHSGIISAAARDLQMTRTALQERIDRSVELMTLLDDMREEAVDVSEFNQLQRAKSGADANAERFVLQTLGKRRGWNTAAGGMNSNGDITVTITKFSEQVIEE